jgi:hypothetical protein
VVKIPSPGATPGVGGIGSRTVVNVSRPSDKVALHNEQPAVAVELSNEHTFVISGQL